MARVFLSHSSKDNPAVLALRDWLVAEGWDDLFLDLDPKRGILGGERWKQALYAAVGRCEAVIFLISRAWLRSKWCRHELTLALRENKRIFGVTIEPIPLDELPVELTQDWQIVSLPWAGPDTPAFPQDGLTKLKAGLERAGLDPRSFDWPPKNEPQRAPWRGMHPMDEEDAGIFFGREEAMVSALDRLRGMAERPAPGVLVILGASGTGKSSFLRAGLLRRLRRDTRNFVTLPVIRPERAVITGGSEGLLTALRKAMANANAPVAEERLQAALEAGASGILALLRDLLHATGGHQDQGAEGPPRSPLIVLALDQAEELFNAAGRSEAETFLALLRDLLLAQDPRILLIMTIRSDSYERMQTNPAMETVPQELFPLSPILRGQWSRLIDGPEQRLAAIGRKFSVEPALKTRLLAEVDDGGGHDILPLLAFTLGRLWERRANPEAMTLKDYVNMGGIAGSVTAAVDRALMRADADPDIPKDTTERLRLLRQGLIPRLAGIDPDSKTPRRRSARLSEIPPETRKLILHLVNERLLSQDRVWTTAPTGLAVADDDSVIEPVHEALLRQWGLLCSWLEEDSAELSALENLRRAARDWQEHGQAAPWAVHRGGRLEDAEKIAEKPDLWGSLGPLEHAYLAGCRQIENAERLARETQLRARRNIALVGGGVASVLAVAATVGWLSARAATGLAEERAASLAVNAARDLATGGRVDAALATLVDAANALKGQAISQDLLDTHTEVMRRALTETRFPVPASAIPFEMDAVLYLHIPETGEVLRIDGSGPPETVFRLPGQMLAAAPIQAGSRHVIATDLGEAVGFWAVEAGGRTAEEIMTIARPEEQIAARMPEWVEIVEGGPVPPLVQIGWDGKALLSWEYEAADNNVETASVFADLKTGQVASVPHYRPVRLEYAISEGELSTRPGPTFDDIIFDDVIGDGAEVEAEDPEYLLARACLGKDLFNQGGEDIARIIARLQLSTENHFLAARCRLYDDLLLVETDEVGGSIAIDRSTSLYRRWYFDQVANNESDTWKSVFNTAPDPFAFPYQHFAAQDGAALLSLFVGPPVSESGEFQQAFGLVDPDGRTVTFVSDSGVSHDSWSTRFEETRVFTTPVAHATMLSIDRAALLLSPETVNSTSAELVMVELRQAGVLTAQRATGNARAGFGPMILAASQVDFCLEWPRPLGDAFRYSLDAGMVLAELQDGGGPLSMRVPQYLFNMANGVICGSVEREGKWAYYELPMSSAIYDGAGVNRLWVHNSTGCRYFLHSGSEPALLEECRGSVAAIRPGEDGVPVRKHVVDLPLLSFEEVRDLKIDRTGGLMAYTVAPRDQEADARFMLLDLQSGDRWDVVDVPAGSVIVPLVEDFSVRSEDWPEGEMRIIRRPSLDDMARTAADALSGQCRFYVQGICQ